MALVRICPVCGEKHPPNKTRCSKCQVGDMSRVVPMEESELEAASKNGMIKCPSCEEINPPGSKECKRCSLPLEDIAPVDNNEPGESGERHLILKLASGHEITVKDGDIIGRYNIAPDNLKVSKVHAKFTLENGKWCIEDLNSTNGTFLNNVRILTNNTVELRAGQKLSFSRSCEMIVQIN